MNTKDQSPIDASLSRRRFLQRTAWMTGAVTLGVGSWVFPAPWASAAGPIKLGIATDLTGAIGYAGNSHANVARWLTEEINAAGGIIGQPIELYIEDTASNESTGVTNTRKLTQRHNVDFVIGGITSSMRNAIKDVIIQRGKKLYIYPEIYEGGACEPYLFGVGPVPAQQCDMLIPWLIKNGGKRFAFPSANYLWPKNLNKYARKVVEENGGEVVFEQYYPLDQVEHGATVNGIISNKVDVVFNTLIPPGLGGFIKGLYEAGFTKKGGRLSCVYYDENMTKLNAPHEWEGMASCLEYYRVIAESGAHPPSTAMMKEYDKRFGSDHLFSAGAGSTGMYRAIKLLQVAVNEAKSVDRDAVSATLDHARVEEAPGGPAEMAPGTRHCSLKMYIAVAKEGRYEIAQSSDGLLHPKECQG